MKAKAIVRVDHLVHSHPAISNAGDEALWLWLRMCCWLAEFPKQGEFIPSYIAKHYGKRRQIAALVAAHMWREVEGGYEVYRGLDIGGCGWTRDMWSIERNDLRKKIPDELRAAIYERDEHACVVCGRADDLTLDHIYPWSLGGTDEYDNLRTLCRPCNSSKGARV